MSWPHTFIPIDPNDIDFETLPPNTTGPPETEKVKGGEETTPSTITEIKSLLTPGVITGLIVIFSLIILGSIAYVFI